MVYVCVCVCSCVRKKKDISCVRVSGKEHNPNDLVYQVDVCVLMGVC